MGVFLIVESILTLDTYPGVNTSVHKVRQITQKAYLDAVCTAMGWHKAPWQEPSETRGIRTSIGNGRYSLLMSLAWAIEDVEIEEREDVNRLRDIVEQTRRSPSEHQYPQLRNRCKIFPHLLDRSIHESFYLPSALDYPIFCHVPISNWRGDGIDQYIDISVASSHHLKNELIRIEPIVKAIAESRDKDYRVPSPNYTWGSVYDACTMLIEAAEDSLRLNLPLKIGW